METLRKYSVLLEYFKDVNQPSIFDRVLDQDDEEYVLMGLSREDCTLVSNAVYEAVALRSWGPVPSSRVPVPEFSVQILNRVGADPEFRKVFFFTLP